MAMANRMPVVTTPFHFALEVVQDSRGIIIPYEDHNGTLFAHAVSALLEDAALREQMVRTSKACMNNDINVKVNSTQAGCHKVTYKMNLSWSAQKNQSRQGRSHPCFCSSNATTALCPHSVTLF